MDDRDLLVEQLDSVYKKEAGIELKHFFIVLVVLFAAILFLVPKIYIRNQIYLASKEIVRLKNEVDALEYKNIKLKKELENKQFKYLVNDFKFDDDK